MNNSILIWTNLLEDEDFTLGTYTLQYILNKNETINHQVFGEYNESKRWVLQTCSHLFLEFV